MKKGEGCGSWQHLCQLAARSVPTRFSYMTDRQLDCFESQPFRYMLDQSPRSVVCYQSLPTVFHKLMLRCQKQGSRPT